jgi:hypothetical protein
VTENVIIAVVGADAKIARLRGIPPAIEFADLERASTNDKTERAFAGAIPRVTLNEYLAHRASAGRKGFHRWRVTTACVV